MSTPEPPAPVEPAAEPPADQPDQPDQPSTWQPLLYLRIAVLLGAIVYSIAFGAENTKPINVHFVFGTASVHLIWEILLLLAVGLVGGVLASQLYRHRRRVQLAKKAGQHRHSSADLVGRDEAEGKPS